MARRYFDNALAWSNAFYHSTNARRRDFRDRGQRSCNGAAIRAGGVRWAASTAICVNFIPSTLPTPLYPLYKEAFHFSQIMLTVVYAVYVVGHGHSDVLFRRLSDQVADVLWC